MAFFAKVGSFPTGTGTTAVAQTGLGFVPKVLVFWTDRRTELVDTQGTQSQTRSIGFGIDATHRRAIGSRQQGTVNERTISHDDACLATCVNAGTVDGLMDIQSIDADGFTVVPDDAFAASQIVHWLALGGSDITNTAVGTLVEPSATGDQDITDAGFQPDCVLLLGSNLGTPTATGNGSSLMFGAAARSAVDGTTIDNAIWAAVTKDTSNPTVTLSYCRSGECVGLFDANATVTDGRASVTSFLSNGFRLNWSERATTTRNIFYLAIKGGAFKVGSVATLTNTTADITASGLGMRPIGGLVLSHATTESASDTPQANEKWSMGAFTASSNQRVLAAVDQNGAIDTTQVATGIHYADVYVNLSSAGAVTASMALRSMNHDGFTFRMTDAEATGAFAWYLAVGSTVNTIPKTPTYSGLRGLGPPAARLLRRVPYFPVTVASAAVDVTVALTGVSTTASPGSLSVVFSLALTGSAATASAGTLSPSLTHTLTGNFATASPGTLSVTFNRALTGNSATGSPGTLSPALAHALTGVVGTGSAGSTSPSNSQALTGPSASVLAGDLSVSSAVGLTGVTASVTAGILSAVITIGLTGNEATGSPGSTEVQGIVLTGVQATVFAGTMGVEISTALSGVIASLFPGTVIYFTPPPPPPGQTLALLLDAAFMAPPSSENPYTAGRKLAAVYCAWATAYRTQLSSAPTGLTTAGYQQLAADLGRIIANQGWRPTAAFAFSEAFTAMWRASGVIFGSEAVTSVGGTRELTLALSESWDPPLLRRTGFGVSLYPSWYNIALALTIYTDTVRTASGLIVYT